MRRPAGAGEVPAGEPLHGGRFARIIIVRQLLPAPELMHTAIFVCTGNTCRSPMAEAIARQWLASSGLGDDRAVFVASAGVAASDGRPIAPEAEVALKRLGIEHEGSTKPLSAQMIRKATIVLCMTEEHARIARDLVAGEDEHQAKIVVLDPAGDIEDPIGFGQAAYDKLATRFQKIVPQRLQELLEAKGVESGR